MAEGLLDTNIFIHAHTRDSLAAECKLFLGALEHGYVQAHLEPLILHELSYALPRYLKQMNRAEVASYLQMILSWVGVLGDKDVMADAVERWWQTPGLAFVDAYLAALANRRGCPVYTKNVRELVGQGVDVPQPLPTGPVS